MFVPIHWVHIIRERESEGERERESERGRRERGRRGRDASVYMTLKSTCAIDCTTRSTS